MEKALESHVMRRMCVGDLLRRSAQKSAKKEALVYSYKGTITTRLTLEELNQKVNRFANALTELGIKKGDRVAIISHNCPQYAIYLYALAKTGAWVTPLNFALKAREITQLINHAEPVAFIVEDELADNVTKLQQDMPSVKHYIMINLAGKKQLPERWLDFDQLCSEKYSDDEPYFEVNGDDVMTLMYTSGTEAMPKGVMNTHANWHSTIMSGVIDLHLLAEDTIINSIPLYHVAGVNLLIGSLSVGTRVIMHHEPSPAEILQLVQNEKVTFLVYPPTIFTNILKLPIPNIEEFMRKSFSSVRIAILFGAPIAGASMRRLVEILPNVYWMNYYGQSELTPLGAILQYPDVLRKFKESEERFGGAEPIGPPHTMVEMKVVDENMNEVPPGTVGEMVARSPSVMLGYYKEPKKTREIFKGGWLHTGDLAIMDEEHYFYFVDRKKDIVKSGGENVSTVEVESLIFDHPKVADAAIVGLPHPRWIEAVTAFVVPKPGESITEEEIIQFCKKNLAGYKVPKKVVVLDELPKNPTGKVLKKDIRNQFKDLYKTS
jgi:fatty-acyl-CoA synthase